MGFWDFLPIRTWYLIALGVIFGYYEYATWHFGIFRKLGIKGPRPIPFLGTNWPLLRHGILKNDLDLKRKYGPVVGTFGGRIPILIIYDNAILKHVLIKDFSNFINRFDAGIREYPMEKMLTLLHDENWKHVRNHMTPAFSSGKLRKMNGKMLKCVETFLNNLEKKAENHETFDFRDMTGAYTMDVIASTAFGLQIDSHNDPNNQFVRMAKKIFEMNLFSFTLVLIMLCPFLLKPLGKLGISIFPRDALNFFVAAVDRAMSERQSLQTENVDFLQLMMDAEVDDEEFNKTEKNAEETWTKSRGLSHEEVLAQGILFFLAGYETTANTLALFGYNLAVNPEVQEKLIKEIDEAMKDQEHVTYDTVQKMPYLEMCLSEILRLYPVGQRTDRVAKHDIVINGLFIPKGMLVQVPIYALQNDPDVWPNPEKFDPERFSSEAKESRDPLCYLPFGVGPRNCVGMRLALMELKMSVVHILQKLKFVVCEETQIPLKLQKLRMKGEKGIKLRMEKR